MFTKTGVVMLAKEHGGDGWWAYYIPFTNIGRVLDPPGTAVLLAQAADWIDENYQTEPDALIGLRKRIADGKGSNFWMLEVAPKP
jgi:hypothetical protein